MIFTIFFFEKIYVSVIKKIKVEFIFNKLVLFLSSLIIIAKIFPFEFAFNIKLLLKFILFLSSTFFKCIFLFSIEFILELNSILVDDIFDLISFKSSFSAPLNKSPKEKSSFGISVKQRNLFL